MKLCFALRMGLNEADAARSACPKGKKCRLLIKKMSIQERADYHFRQIKCNVFISLKIE